MHAGCAEVYLPVASLIQHFFGLVAFEIGREIQADDQGNFFAQWGWETAADLDRPDAGDKECGGQGQYAKPEKAKSDKIL